MGFSTFLRSLSADHMIRVMVWADRNLPAGRHYGGFLTDEQLQTLRTMLDLNKGVC